MRRRTIALLAAVATAFVFTPTATAQSPSGFNLDRTEYNIGEVIRVSARAASGCGQVTSPGFMAPIDLHVLPGNPPALYGDGQATYTPGLYTAQSTCLAGEVVKRTFTVKNLYPSQFSFKLDKDEYDPGAEILINAVYISGRCPSTVTSPGFAAPIYLDKNPGPGTALVGRGKAVTTPGTYTAEVKCEAAPPFTQTFKVKGGPPTTPPPSGSPKPPIVKPRGAPQTGGGGTVTGITR
jgi:hypothetical protein